MVKVELSPRLVKKIWEKSAQRMINEIEKIIADYTCNKISIWWDEVDFPFCYIGPTLPLFNFKKYNFFTRLLSNLFVKNIPHIRINFRERFCEIILRDPRLLEKTNLDRINGIVEEESKRFYGGIIKGLSPIKLSLTI